MAHTDQKDFCVRMKQRYPQLFANRQVLDVGSRDINGNNRFLFDTGSYIGLDVNPGANVDLVGKIHTLDQPDGSYDFIVSTEMLEHDFYWEQSIKAMVRLLRKNGALLMTCGGENRGVHGLNNFTCPEAPNHYRNIGMTEFLLATEEKMKHLVVEYNPYKCDLYYFGIRRG